MLMFDEWDRVIPEELLYWSWELMLKKKKTFQGFFFFISRLDTRINRVDLTEKPSRSAMCDTSVSKNGCKDLSIFSISEEEDEERKLSLISKFCAWSGLGAKPVTGLTKPHKWAAKCVQGCNSPKSALHECFGSVLITHHINNPLCSVHRPQALISISAFRSQMPITRFFLFAHWNWLFFSLPQEINLFTHSYKQQDNYLVNYAISFDI